MTSDKAWPRFYARALVFLVICISLVSNKARKLPRLPRYYFFFPFPGYSSHLISTHVPDSFLFPPEVEKMI